MANNNSCGNKYILKVSKKGNADGILYIVNGTKIKLSS